MEPVYELSENLWLAPSPAGAYYAVSSDAPDAGRTLLLNIMRQQCAGPLHADWLAQLSGLPADQAVALLSELQQARLVQGLEIDYAPPEGPLEKILPGLLAELAAADGQVLLSDDEGLTLASHGIDGAQAEQLSALSAGLSQLYQRHQRLINEDLALAGSGWALVGAGGASEVGFWPLYIDPCRFVLMVRGAPNLNRPALVSLIWSLTRRYGGN